ncbi:hypothetical protein F511_15259 [Dorcoceras hygrometricum]|uniref:Uncharacterized protein n=1 Tax=Dorcoceras hygrometricum TaxID=472368 RepID=A0A2Z7DEF9_9LAMI|nr:hypothetical protein F511_15259 [Dorcoceras hygrometricum]
MMTSAYLLEEAVISNDDVSIADWKKSRISNYDLVSAMMTSACLLEEAMSSKDDVSNISRQLSGNSNDDVSSDVITISS